MILADTKSCRDTSSLLKTHLFSHRGVPVGVVYAGNSVILTTDSNSMWTVQSRSNFDDDGAHPVPYLQLVPPVRRVALREGVSPIP